MSPERVIVLCLLLASCHASPSARVESSPEPEIPSETTSVDSVMTALQQAWRDRACVRSTSHLKVIGPRGEVMQAMSMQLAGDRAAAAVQWAVPGLTSTVMGRQVQRGRAQEPVPVDGVTPAIALARMVGVRGVPVEAWLFFGPPADQRDPAAFLLSLMCGGTVGKIDSMMLLDAPAGQARIELKGLGGRALVTIDTARHVPVEARCTSIVQGARGMALESVFTWDTTFPRSLEPPIEFLTPGESAP